jgi:hypothetical protein
VPAHRSREHDAQACGADEIVERVGSSRIVLLDDRPLVESVVAVVRGRSDELDATPLRLVVGFPMNARKWWMLMIRDG